MTAAHLTPASLRKGALLSPLACLSSLVLTLGLAACTPADPTLEKGRDAVLLHYIKHSGWYPIRCEEGRYEIFDTLYCHPSGEPSIGGLHIIDRENGEPIVYPINGTAMGNMRQMTIQAIDTSRVAVREWTGRPIDISKAIDATL